MSIERRRRECPPEAKDSLRSSFRGGARGLSPLHHEGANTIFLTNKKLSLDKRLQYIKKVNEENWQNMLINSFANILPINFLSWG